MLSGGRKADVGAGFTAENPADWGRSDGEFPRAPCKEPEKPLGDQGWVPGGRDLSQPSQGSPEGRPVVDHTNEPITGL